MTFHGHSRSLVVAFRIATSYVVPETVRYGENVCLSFRRFDTKHGSTGVSEAGRSSELS